MGGNNQLTTMARARIEKELRDIEENAPMNWKIHNPRSDTWSIWITADIDCPFHSIPFEVIVKFPNDYPQCLPQIKIASYDRFFHPNVRNDGLICQATVNKIESSINIRDRVDALITLLSVPNPDSAYNTEAARLYKKDYHNYYKKALHKFRGIS